jgi:UDP-N-acetylmuramyl pentapeptide synthase
MTNSEASFDWRKITENELFFAGIRGRVAVMRDHKKAVKYPGNVNDQIIIQTMAGNL